MRAVHVAGKVRHMNGWRRDLPDPRDRLMAESPMAVHVPDEVDLRSECPPIFDQGPLGTCTANAISAAMMIIERKEGKAFNPFSRRFIYDIERIIEGVPLTEDSGAQIRNGFKGIGKWGAPYEEDFQYDLNKWTEAPTPDIYTKAEKHQALYYYRCPSLTTVLSSMAQGFPVVFGFSVPENMMSDECAKTGIVMPPKSVEGWAGGHAVMAVGYNKNFRFTDSVVGGVLCQNSWGEQWGISGHFWLPMIFWQGGQGALASDCWTLRRMEIV
jgi:C1A family cysteine protease